MGAGERRAGVCCGGSLLPFTSAAAEPQPQTARTQACSSRPAESPACDAPGAAVGQTPGTCYRKNNMITLMYISQLYFDICLLRGEGATGTIILKL